MGILNWSQDTILVDLPAEPQIVDESHEKKDKNWKFGQIEFGVYGVCQEQEIGLYFK